MPIITVGVIIIGIYAEPICEFVFGDGYAESGAILRLLLPAAWVILPTYVVAFHSVYLLIHQTDLQSLHF